VARMQDTGEPCGMPLVTGLSSSWMPSRQTATCLSCKNEAVHLTIVKGMFFCRKTLRSLGWLTKSKYPLMSKQRADITSL
ncbi:hypothetical protein K439DRAFT_1341029, partial [Ramaria rubella]